MGLFGGNREVAEGQNPEVAMNHAAQAAQKCSPQLTSFFKCLENNGSNINNCQWSYDLLKQCQSEVEKTY